MNILKKLLVCLVYLYVILMAILPSDLKFKGITYIDLLFVLIALVYSINIILNNESRKRFIKGVKDFCTDYLTISMGALFLIMLVSESYAADRTMALKESLRFLYYIILFFIIKYEIIAKKILSNVIKAYIFTCSIISIYGIIQFFTRFGVKRDFIYNIDRYSVGVRIPSTLENPNSLGAFLILVIFPLIMMTVYEKNKSKKILYSILSMLILSNIILSFSRNTWLGLAIGIFLLIIVYNWKAIFIFVGGGIVSFFVPPIKNRLQDFRGIFNDPRVKLWKAAFKMIKDHPILGVGNGNYYTLYGEYAKKYPEVNYHDHVNFPVHNSYLKVQSELGIPGICVFIAMIVLILVKTNKFITKISDKFFLGFYKGYFISIIVFFIMNISDNLLFVPKISMYFWILVAISQSMIYNNSRDFRKCNIK